MAEGRRGPQALSVRLVDAPPSVVEAARRPAEDLHSLIEDMIRLLETKVQPDLRRGRYPDRRTCKLAAEVVRAVARDLDGS
jgi:CspA family cold shock protein